MSGAITKQILPFLAAFLLLALAALRAGGASRPNIVAIFTSARSQPVPAARLYNLGRAIGETKALAAMMPDKVKELQSKQDTWGKFKVAPLWGGGQRNQGGAEPGAPAT